MNPAAGRASPRLYPLRLEGGRLGWLELDEEAYRRASFLDERLLTGDAALQWSDWPDLAGPHLAGPSLAGADLAGAGLARVPHPVRTHFIFHIGHVGSTLLSRLMGEHPALFSVREPALMQRVASGELARERERLLALFARVWRDEQTALIKATSFVSAIGRELMQDAPDGRAILLGSTPPTYLRTILGGPASRQEAQMLAPVRRRRLSRRLGAPVTVEGEGETIAMNWLCETSSLYDVAQADPPRCLWIDFDRVLAEPVAFLRLAVRHLGADPQAIDIKALVQGPMMRRYSKAPEHAYDAGLRRRVLDQAGYEAAGEIARGMDWLQRMAAAFPMVALVLQRSAALSRLACPAA